MVVAVSYNIKLILKNMDTHKSPLTPHRTNLPQTPSQPKKSRDDKLLLAVEQQLNHNKACDLLSIIMADPQLKQLNSSLEREAQQQKKSRLLQSFPIRYNTLVQTQALYRQLQGEMKQQKRLQSEMVQKYSNQLNQLRQNINQLEQQLTAKDQQITNIVLKHEQQLQQLQHDRRRDMDMKDKEMLIKDTQYHELQKKYIKLKTEKDHTTQYIDQLKQECEVLKTENNRIVVNLTHKELQIQHLTQTIALQQQQHKAELQALMEQMGQIQNQFIVRFEQKNQQYAELEHILHTTTAALHNCETQLNKTRDKHKNRMCQTEKLIQQKDYEIAAAKEEIMTLRNEIKVMQQRIIAIETAHRQKLNQLDSNIHQLHIDREQMKNQYQSEIITLHNTIDHMQNNHDITQAQNSTKLAELQQIKAELKQTITQLQSQKQWMTQQLSTNTTHNQQLITQLQHTQTQVHKQQASHKNIQQMIGQFKKQLLNYDSIINQKQQKIQSYRKEIIALRREGKQMAITTHQMLANAQQTEQHITHLVEEKHQMEIKYKELQLQQIQLYNVITKKQMGSAGTQTQTDCHTEQVNGQMQQLRVQLDKARLKYQNVIEQLNQYRRQFTEQLAQKNNIIQQLQDQLIAINTSSPTPTPSSNKHLQQMIQTKIAQLKQFYESKLQQQGSKYRKIIYTLKTQMTQLYNDIDLKKSIEDEMYSQIMRINAERRTKTDSH